MSNSRGANRWTGTGHPKALAFHKQPKTFLGAQSSRGQLGRYTSRSGAIAPIDHSDDLGSFTLGETV